MSLLQIGKFDVGLQNILLCDKSASEFRIPPCDAHFNRIQSIRVDIEVSKPILGESMCIIGQSLLEVL